MAVYLTKTMMSRLNKVTYPSTSSIEDEFNNYNDQWEKLMMDR